MKKIIFTICLIILVKLVAGQDTIVKKTGEKISGKISLITSTDIQYQTGGNSTYSILISDVFMIKYENGTKKVFNENTSEQQDTTSNNYNNNSEQANSAMCDQAVHDAILYYKGDNHFWNNFCFTGGINPICGLALAIPSASTKPKTANLKMPYNQTTLDSKTYRDCYAKEAYKIKKRNVWGGYGTGVALYAVVIIIYITTVLSK